MTQTDLIIKQLIKPKKSPKNKTKITEFYRLKPLCLMFLCVVKKKISAYNI